MTAREVLAETDVEGAAGLSRTSESLPIALTRARDAVMAYFRPNHREHGLTDAQWRVLRILDERGSLEVTVLAEECALLAPSVSRILRGFQAEDLVQKHAVKSDGRRSLVRITARGKKRLRAGAKEINQVYQDIVDRYGEDRLRQLLRLLVELETALAPRKGNS